ncbi:unnamed protein product [Schistosoma mattheei]|uniref:Uncharacterized protein n=1 Tax=Schistosoma mattheei TaxID=31246 RepID=A0A183P8D4_9TREM|nr:unnamed protein product [Schistosoma mattheei]
MIIQTCVLRNLMCLWKQARSYRWQLFREKIWSVIDISPRLIHSRFSNYRQRKQYTPNELFCNDYSSTSDQSNSNDNPSFNSNQKSINPINHYSISNEQSDDSLESKSFHLSTTIQSMNQYCHEKINKCTKCSNCYPMNNHESIYLIWLRHFYFIYETLIITSAVGVFMLSTVKEYRIPFYINITEYTDAYNDTIIDYTNNHLEIITLFNQSDKTNYIYTYNNDNHYHTNPDSIWWLIRILKVEEYFIILKVFVVLRLFRLLRRHRGTRVLFYTIRTTITDLSIIIILILVSALFFGAAIYFVDPTFTDIPKGFWWALITMSTVGYGDLVPNNTGGYIVATACIILGTLLVSYTIPVLVNHFLLYYAHADQLSMVKQLHRTAKRKIRNRKMSRYLQKALFNAKSIVSSTMTNVNNNKT